MKYKRLRKYYFVNKKSKKLDSLLIIDIVENGFIYSYNEEYKFCSFKNAEGKLYESDIDPELLSKLGKCRQNCYYSRTKNCHSTFRCPCPIFIHVNDPAANEKVAFRKAQAEKPPEIEDLKLYPFGDR